LSTKVGPTGAPDGHHAFHRFPRHQRRHHEALCSAFGVPGICSAAGRARVVDVLGAPACDQAADDAFAHGDVSI
jgi:hypothetical protein